jgi:hypothetical protein
MAKQTGRPRKGPDQTKGEFLQIRVERAEKESFFAAAELAGLDLSAWVRVRLRLLARKELEQAGQTIPFMRTREKAQEKNSAR